MKIWILEIGEPLPLEKDIRLHRYGQFSKYLAQVAGHEVTWWTSSFSHAPKKHLVDKDTDHSDGNWTLRLLKGPGYSRNVSLARIQHQKHFAARFLQLADKYPKPNLIISPVPTIDNAKAAITYAQDNKIPGVVDIRDLWPDELRDLAPKALRPVAQLMLNSAYQKMSHVCKNASAIMAVSQSYLDYGLKFAEREQGKHDLVFPLGYSDKTFTQEKMKQAEEWSRRLAIKPQEFVVCFFGTIGNYFDLDTVIETARHLKDRIPVRFILAGHGSRLDYYKQKAAGLGNVEFPGWLNGPQIQAVMQKSHVGLAPYAHDAKMSLPNKPFEYMAGGLAIASSIQGELKYILEENQCGLTYQANSTESLSQTLITLYEDPKLRKKMGANARNLLQQHFASEKIFANVNDHISRISERGLKNASPLH